MAASVRIEDEAFVDPRVELLGTLAGYNRYEALGRLAHLWRVCTQRETYVLAESFVVACLGEKGPDAIVTAGLGERVPEGIRVKGTAGRIEWLRVRREAAKTGGRANKERLEARGKPNGSQTGAKRSQSRSTRLSQTGAKREPEGSQTNPNGSPPTASPTPTASLDLPSEEVIPPPDPPPGGGAIHRPEDVPIPVEIDTPEFRGAWGKYLAHRAAMPKAKRLSVNGAELNLKKLVPFGAICATDLVERAVMSGWQGIVFPDRPGPRLHQPGAKATAADVIAAAKAKRESQQQPQTPLEGAGA